jgi:hypothetical protein
VSEEATLIRLVGVTRALLDTLADDRLAALVDNQTLARVRALRDRADARLRDLTDAPEPDGPDVPPPPDPEPDPDGK